MYQIRQNARAARDEWSGPARMIGFDSNVVWSQHGAVPVTSAVHKLRPASTAKMLAPQVMSRRMMSKVRLPQDSGTQQTGYADQRSTGRPDEVERMADTNCERSVDEESLTHGDELFGSVPVKRQRREGDVTTQSTTAQDDQMLSPLRNTRNRSEFRAPILAEDLQYDYGRDLEWPKRERVPDHVREATTPTANILVHDFEPRTILVAFEADQSFFADRAQRPEALRYAGKRLQKETLQERRKLSQYDQVTLEMQKLLDVSTFSEWNNVLKFTRRCRAHVEKTQMPRSCPLNG